MTMKQRLNKRGKQQGVVLLSCLIFMLILFALLRFTLGSSRMSELKAGADVDLTKAREVSSIVAKEAELFILQKDHNGNDTPLFTSAQKKSLKEFWGDSSVWSNNPGIYDGFKCRSDECVEVNWTIPCGTATACLSQGNANKGKYIIEVIKGDDPDLRLGGTDANNIIFRVTGVGFSQATGDRAENKWQSVYVLY